MSRCLSLNLCFRRIQVLLKCLCLTVNFSFLCRAAGYIVVMHFGNYHCYQHPKRAYELLMLGPVVSRKVGSEQLR